MSSERDLAEYVFQKLSRFGEVQIKPMFGEFCFYLDERPIVFLADNHVLVKTNAFMRGMHPEVPTLYLFEGAKEPMWYVENLENEELLKSLVMCAKTYLPESKKKKTSRISPQRRREGEGSPLKDPDLFVEKP